MAKVDPNEYGSGEQRAKLTPEVLGSPETAVLTVQEARTGIETVDGRRAALLVFEEQPDHVYWLNKTGISTLVERLGGDDSDWIGRQVPLIRVQASNPSTGGSVVTFHVAPLTEWDELLVENGTVEEAEETSRDDA